ncbi:MAG: pitrilysin family protein [Bacteroidales bacterium]
MVTFEKHILSNGMRVIAHRDPSTPMAAFNLLYDVGARDEHPGHTGFAHLFEHLMFEGSVNIPDFDARLQSAGGENNAFTTNDLTNYYITLPAGNLETAFWLESDRMLGLALHEEKLSIQKKVVEEEYLQSYLNQPYGDTWLLLRPLAYQKHPYQWATIGKSLDHIRQATLKQVAGFFDAFYHPGNAILSVSGNIDPEAVFRLAEKWFGSIPALHRPARKLPAEPLQTAERRLVVRRNVPSSQVFLAFHCCERGHPDFFATDLLSDLLAHGDSSRLFTKLVKEENLFSEVDAYLSGSLDPGLFLVHARLHDGITALQAEAAIWKELEDLTGKAPGEEELQKVKNKVESAHTFSETNVLGKAINLAYHELMGDADLINRQMVHYFGVSADDIQARARHLFKRENASVLHYLADETPDLTNIG